MNLRDLQQRQSLPLEAKINLTKRRIREWYEENKGLVYVAFSGGKDSTVLLHLVRSEFPDVPAVFVDTGLEFPEIKAFVKEHANVTTLRPDKSFYDVIKEDGYPIVSKKVARMVNVLKNPTEANKNTRRLYLTGIKKDGKSAHFFKLPQKWRYLVDAPFKISDSCCKIMKKNPVEKYKKETGRVPFVGIMASDSSLRVGLYLKEGCNSYKSKDPRSMPLGFWLEADIWEYIKKFKIPYCPIYNKGYDRTGCMFCMFGVHLEKGQNRFQIMKNTHPQLYTYCMEKLGLKEVLKYIKVESLSEQRTLEVNNAEG